MSQDQKRAFAILIVTGIVIATLAIGVGWLATSLGAPLWIVLAVVIIVTAVVGLFMFLQMS